MEFDRGAWAEAGGHLDDVELYGSVARVAAITEGDGRILAAVHPRDPSVGLLWDWVGGEEPLRAAEGWLRDSGCRVARGPMAVCTWFDHRANLGPFDDAPMAREPMAEGAPWSRAGYRVLREYASVVSPHHSSIRAAVSPAAALASSGWSIDTPGDGGGEPLSERAFAEYLADMSAMAERVYGDEPEFAPMPIDVLLRYFGPVRAHLDARLLVRARDPDGELAALLWAYPDTLCPERGWFVLRTLFLSRAHRDLGVGAWTVGAAHQAARKAGYTEGIRSLVPIRHSDTSGTRGARLVRRYALYERVL